MKGLNEFSQKLDVVAAVIFTLINVTGVPESKLQQPCYFCYDSGWTFCSSIISLLYTIAEYYHMECLLFTMWPTCYLFPTTEIYFQFTISISFEVIYKNTLQVTGYLQPHISYMLSYTNSSSTQLKVFSN